MKLLFIGNSITHGQVGKNFVTLLQADNPDWNLRNAGINGDTLKNISDRIKKEISGANYDYIVIEAGHNDIILPHFKNKGILFQFALKYLLQRGRQPLNPNDFKTEYAQMMEFIQSVTKAKIIITTLSCIGENLSTDLNYKRQEYNNAIRNIAERYQCLLADVADAFDSLLRKNIQADYFLNNFFDTVYFDKNKCQKVTGPEELSQRRKLLLTIDGVHLNDNGANLYKKIIEDRIKNGC